LTTYSSELDADPRLRRLVLICGWLALVAGAIVCLSMPLAWEWRLAASSLWILVSERELLVMAIGHKRYSGVRLDANGDAALLTRGGDWSPATLLAGSLVLSSLAWLRFKDQDGRQRVELIACKCPENKAWRRLQVIWRHLGAGG
jgi:hypothetical protein